MVAGAVHPQGPADLGCTRTCLGAGSAARDGYISAPTATSIVPVQVVADRDKPSEDAMSEK